MTGNPMLDLQKDMSPATESEKWLAERGYRGRFSWYSWKRPPGFLVNEFILRGEYIRQFGFAILTGDAIERVKQILGRCVRILEVGAGSGYWSHEFRIAGVDCIAVDPGTHSYLVGECGQDVVNWRADSRQFGEVGDMTGVEALRKYGHQRTLMMIWPDKRSWAFETLQAYEGRCLILCGEPPGGLTGDDELFELLRREWIEIDEVLIPNFFGIRDCITVYARADEAAT